LAKNNTRGGEKRDREGKGIVQSRTGLHVVQGDGGGFRGILKKEQKWSPVERGKLTDLYFRKALKR